MTSPAPAPTARSVEILWQRLDDLAAAHAIDWHWVKGHSGAPGNEHVDLLANQAIDAMLR